MMKKTTLLIALLTMVSFGYSQQLPFTFSESDDASFYFTGFDCGFALTVDPDDASNPVGEITGGANQNFDTIQTLSLEQNIDLSDDSNNTITFRFRPVNGTGSGSHLLKFEGGSPIVEMAFTSSGTDWQTISVDFGTGLGNYGNLIIFPDFNNASSDTYLIDDISGGTNVAPPSLPDPAPNPATPDSDVYRISSDTGGYTNGFDYGGDCFGTLDGEPDLDPGAVSNKAFRFDFSVAGWGCTNSATVDVSTIGGNPIAFASFQYYTDDATDFFFDLISGPAGSTTESFYYVGQSSAGGAPAADEAIVQGSWQHVVIPIAEFTSQTFDPTELFQFKFDVFAGATPGIVYIDNILLSSSSPLLGIQDLRLEGISIYPNPTKNNWTFNTADNQISSVKVFDILGKNIMTVEPQSDNFTVNASNLSKGIYLARIESVNGNKTVKLVKD